ncbi:MAG: sugar phosphate isomerase/epimerase family protein [Pseudomonadales bacterium]
MLNKREFVNGLCTVGAGLLLSSCRGHSSTPTTAIMKPGIQLYTLREPLKKDPAKTLGAVAHIGYKEVELAGLPEGVSARQFRAMLDDLQLVCPAIHLQGEIAQQAEIAHAVGASMVVQAVPLELLNEDWQLKAGTSLDDFRKFAANLNAKGEEAKSAGVSFGFHNHAWEMARIEGKLAYEVLLEETDPELVFMELDLGWTHVGEVDALQLFRGFPGRFKTCHIKDFSSDNKIVELGAGVVPLEAQLVEYPAAGFQHFFVEHDDTHTPIDTARRSYAYLQKRNFI